MAFYYHVSSEIRIDKRPIGSQPVVDRQCFNVSPLRSLVLLFFDKTRFIFILSIPGEVGVLFVFGFIELDLLCVVVVVVVVWNAFW